MKFLNSILETVKKYWYLLIISALTIMVIAVGFIENSKMAGLVNAVKDIVQNYKKQVKTIDTLANKKAKEDQKVTKTYEERTKEIQDKRDAELSKVNAKKIEVVKELKDKSAEELAKKMKEEFKL
jgi:cell division protein FtsX